MSDAAYPIALFRFHVDFHQVSLANGTEQDQVPICRGAFAECTGLEANMEAKVIRAGGWNYGAHQRSGPVTFGTVVLKRGITESRDLWKWFAHVTERGRYAYRLNVTIRIAGAAEDLPGEALTVRLLRAVPVKFKCGDLNARATDVGIEELHLAHEGLVFE
jgi:phage tail-like protein